MIIEPEVKLLRPVWPLMVILGAEEVKGTIIGECCMGAFAYFHYTGIRFVRKQG